MLSVTYLPKREALISQSNQTILLHLLSQLKPSHFNENKAILHNIINSFLQMSSRYEFNFSKNKTIHLRSCSKCLPLARTHACSLGRHSSIALSTTVCFMSAQTEMRRCFRSSTSRIEVWYTRSCIKPQIL